MSKVDHLHLDELSETLGTLVLVVGDALRIVDKQQGAGEEVEGCLSLKQGVYLLQFF